MATFDYKAIDSSGAKSEGEIEAADQEIAISQLESDNLIVVQVTQKKDVVDLPFLSASKVSLEDIEFLTSELSLLLESGVRIDRGIDMIRKTKAKIGLARLLNEISKDLKKGDSLSQAFSKHDHVFDPLYCNLIELGEASGNLSEVFKGLSQDLKFRKELRSKILSALAYPMVILAVCVLSIFFIFNFIIPQMAGMFESAKNLPWYTSLMLSASEWMMKYQWLLVLTILVGIFGIALGAKQEKFILWWHSFSLRLPIIKKAIINIERIRFNSGLALMLASGVQIDRAIRLSSGNIKNSVLRKEMEVAKAKIKSGSLLTPALRQTEIYPDFFASLLEVGEESGTLERVFSEIATRSKQEFESWTERVTNLLEPLMILFMGGFVGSVVIIMLLSMVSMNEIGV